MNVFACGINTKLSAFQIFQNPAQCFDQRLSLVSGNNALLCQHGGMCDGPVDIFTEHLFVKVNGGIKVIGNLVDFTAAASLPKFCHGFALAVYDFSIE